MNRKSPAPGIQEEIQAPVGDDQHPAHVERICARVRDILTSDEKIEYVAVQKRLPVNPIPDAIVLTNRRFIVYRPKLLGRVNFEDYVWRDLTDVHLEERIIGSTITFVSTGGQQPSISYLPKVQARRIYALAQEREEKVREQQRLRQLEEKRAAAGGIVVQGSTRESGGSPNSPQDPVERLELLKKMLDAGLISAEEYEAKRAEIIARM